ncbi:hypothetical protein Poli38472_005548 [Pythium oligandrum]|uniref:Uncharacterized protein n=1 Tax=Pythium oligandrum TaxID=41045 RepID=A0A8K1CHQ7_PYTOL|nr:hypothetical protein Poli38472_005548 [Pythium oligandrum]|eukprot:TMW62930.1 hypothetical protein Poli38472_005548 [Pythium oligandrum]
MTSSSTPPSTLALASAAHLKPFGPLEHYSANLPWAVFPRKKLDVTYGDILSGIKSCMTLGEGQREEYERKIATHWDATGQSMVTLSVRTGFDLLLQVLKLPAGSEILCSAITIPDMIYLVRYHGLVPVPIDLDPDTLAIDPEKLRSAVTDKTRAIMIAHIFGTVHPLGAILDLAEELNLMVIEDCAQAFAGMDYTGERGADVSMFSFGTIKTATAFGGAMIRVKNPSILEEMKRRESRYPTRSTTFFLKRLVKYGFLHGVSTPALYGLLLHGCRAVGANHDSVITAAIRGFSGGELVSLIRYRPSMPLLGLLHRRLTDVDDAYIHLRKSKSEQLMAAIQDTPNVLIPGYKAMNHYYWLCPVVVPSPERVVKHMNQQGFDVTSGATQLAYIPSPKGEVHDPVHAKQIMQNLVYLPITPETPNWAVEKMIQSFREALQSSRM